MSTQNVLAFDFADPRVLKLYIEANIGLNSPPPKKWNV